MVPPGFDLQRQFFTFISVEDYDRAVEIFAENGSFFSPYVSEKKGIRAIRRLLRMTRKRFSRLEWRSAPHVASEPDLLYCRWTVDGTYLSGNPYRSEGFSLLRFDANGKVLAFKDYFVNTDFSAYAKTDRREPLTPGNARRVRP